MERSKLTGSPPLDMERKPAPIQLKILQQRAEFVWGVTPHKHRKNIRQGRGGFPKIFPFSMAGADLPAFLGFQDGAFGFAPALVSATGSACF